MTLADSPETATPAVQARRAYRIVLIDGHRIFRQAVQSLLAAEGEFTVVGEAGHAAEAVELIGSLQPDVAVTDLHLADGSAVPLIEQIHARFPKVAILVLTSARAHDGAAARSRSESTRLNSSHTVISYAVLCVKKKKQRQRRSDAALQHRKPAAMP